MPLSIETRLRQHRNFGLIDVLDNITKYLLWMKSKFQWKAQKRRKVEIILKKLIDFHRFYSWQSTGSDMIFFLFANEHNRNELIIILISIIFNHFYRKANRH